MNAETSAIVAQVFSLLDVHNFFDLHRAYTYEDQKIMKEGSLNTRNPLHITNQVRMLLEQIDPDDLTESDRGWYWEILWFWYHHAISYAIWRAHDKVLAQAYAAKALTLQMKAQPPELVQPNWLTTLLWLLVYDKVAEAKQWMADMPSDADPVERESGLELIQEYEQGEFF